MGTRNLTCVVKGGKYVVAKYCQWDGYPSGQGRTILAFLRDEIDLAKFEAQLDKCRFIEEAELDACLAEAGIGLDGWAGVEQSRAYAEKYPTLERGMGGEILEYIQAFEGDEIKLVDSIDFAKDGLFCEWCYVVDLDNDVLEVHQGFNKGEMVRFGSERNDDGYLPVGLIKTYELDALPDEGTFLKDLEGPDEEEDDD